MVLHRRTIPLNSHQIKRWFLAAALLMVLVAIKSVLYQTPWQADAYHQKIVSVAATVPAHFGSWVSLDAPVPDAAMTMLRPNLAVSRKYTNLTTGAEASFLLIQCKDARDMFGHFPPVCYKANGYILTASVPRDWTIGGHLIHSMVYTFSSPQPDDPSSMVVFDFMMLPNGTTCPNMDGIFASARDPWTRKLGAAQLQVLVSATMPEASRDDVFRSLVEANHRTIDAILAGGKKS